MVKVIYRTFLRVEAKGKGRMVEQWGSYESLTKNLRLALFGIFPRPLVWSLCRQTASRYHAWDVRYLRLAVLQYIVK